MACLPHLEERRKEEEEEEEDITHTKKAGQAAEEEESKARQAQPSQAKPSWAGSKSKRTKRGTKKGSSWTAIPANHGSIDLSKVRGQPPLDLRASIRSLGRPRG